MRPRDYARRLLAESPPATLPIQPAAYIEKLGFTIRAEEMADRALLSWGQRLVLISAGLREASARWYLAHELAHLILPEHESQSSDDAEARKLRFEREANEFAAELLMPWPLLEREYEAIRGVPGESWVGKLATIFGVTPEVMRIRLSASSKPEFKRAVQLWRG